MFVTDFRTGIEETYGMRIREIRRVKDVFRIRTRLGTYCLKGYDVQVEEVFYIARVFACLDERGFTRSPKVYPTTALSPVMIHQGSVYMLTNWVHGRQPDFGSAADLRKGLRSLARFHAAAEGFPAGEAPASRIRYFDLEKDVSDYKDLLGCYENTRHLVPPCEEAISRLREPAVLAAITAEQQASAFIHGDYNYPNLIKDKRGKLHLIDFENSSLHVRMKDLAHILHRNFTWNAGGMLRAVEYYQRHRQLSAPDLSLLHALLSAPYPVVRSIKIGGIQSAARVIPSTDRFLQYQKELGALLTSS
ncbi:sporulation protein [Paenibacillus sp. SSG-1]|nr:sporulation protein [Paenibacillus sp. SSG-1]